MNTSTDFNNLKDDDFKNFTLGGFAKLTKDQTDKVLAFLKTKGVEIKDLEVSSTGVVSAQVKRNGSATFDAVVEMPSPDTLSFDIQGKDRFKSQHLTTGLESYLHSRYYGTENYYFDSKSELNFSDGFADFMIQLDNDKVSSLIVNSLLKHNAIIENFVGIKFYFNNGKVKIIIDDGNDNVYDTIENIDTSYLGNDEIRCFYNGDYQVCCLMSEY